MDPIREQIDVMTRRHFFGRTGVGLGTAALASLLAESAALAARHRRPAERRRRRRPAACPVCPISRPRRSGRSTCS